MDGEDDAGAILGRYPTVGFGQRAGLIRGEGEF